MNYFEEILVPVDFTVNTEVAVKKAVELAIPGFTSIILYHVITDTNRKTAAQQAAANAERKLQQWKQQVAELEPELDVDIVVQPGSHIENSIISFAASLGDCLIVIGKNHYHSFFPFLNTVVSANIAEQCGRAVLTVMPGSICKSLKTVLIPVGTFFPQKKIEVLLKLGLRLKLKVQLLSIFHNDQQPDDHTNSILLQTMRAIRSRLQCPVQHTIIHSNSKAMATLRFAGKIGADLLLVNPETDASVAKWICKKDITAVSSPVSQLQVISIQPVAAES
ncbi:MAG TPA: universal stress protein [Chitinophagaceae bacterium]